MTINKSKTKELVIDFSKTSTNFPTIRIDGTDTQRVTEAKILGITITSNLTWDVHVDEITRKAGKSLFLLLQLKRSGIPAEDLLTVYTTVVRPTLEYACPAWSTSLTMGLQTDMERVQLKTCYEHCIPEHSLYRSISECTADFSETKTCAVM